MSFGGPVYMKTFWKSFGGSSILKSSGYSLSIEELQEIFYLWDSFESFQAIKEPDR